jgi:hypothetical protein
VSPSSAFGTAAHVDAGSTVEVSVPVQPPPKPLLCRLNLHHKSVRRFNQQHDDYLQCKACGKDRYDVERSDPTATNFGGPIAS